MTTDWRDITKTVERMFPNDYPAQTGTLRATLTSVLISVKVRNPELFEHIVGHEMETLKRLAKESLD
jgi:hypothetical protein